MVDAVRLAELANLEADGGGSLLDVITRLFVRSEAPRSIQSLLQASTTGDTTRFCAEAHKLAGSALVLGASALVQVCRTAEVLTEPGDMAAMLSEIQRQLERVIGVLEDSQSAMSMRSRKNERR